MKDLKGLANSANPFPRRLVGRSHVSVRGGVFEGFLTSSDMALALALLVLVAFTVWSFLEDLRSLRLHALSEEIHGMRFQAAEAVGHIEQELESTGGASLDSLAVGDVLARTRASLDGDADQFPYAAVVTLNGLIVGHTDRERQGKQLGHEWYESVVYDLGTDVVLTRSPVLTPGTTAYDVRVPIVVDGEEVGKYHIGLSQAWFDRRLVGARSEFFLRRSLPLAGIFVVTVLTIAAIIARSRRLLTLQKTVTDTYMQAASELGRLAAGLAHEVRNPLHALRLNLHAFRRTQQNPTALEPTEIARMLEQSSCEIDRIDKLLHQLIDFATPNEPRAKAFNLNSELEGVVDFIRQELRRNNTDVQLEMPKSPISVCMDPARLRQIMLNLLHNARDSMPEGGQITVKLLRKDAQVEILVADQGGGIAEADRPHIFEPFFSASDDGTGLGLALVKRFVQEAGGDIDCEPNQPHGTRFRIRLIEAANGRHHGSS